MKYKVISLDGGGVRGYAAVKLLGVLTKKGLCEGLLDNCTLFAGTSIGAINACGFASGKTPRQMELFYRVHTEDIFNRTALKRIFAPRSLFVSRYENNGLLKALGEIFEDKKIKDCKTDLLVPSFDFSRGKMKLFDYQDSNELLIDITARSTAIPWIFPLYEDEKGFWLDGGVGANNPVVLAITQLISKDFKYKADIEDITMLSIGTGNAQKAIEGLTKKNMGLVDWSMKSRLLADIVLDTPNELNDYTAKQLLGDRYFRLNLDIGHLRLDSPDTLGEIDRLLDEGKAGVQLEQCIQWCDEVGMS